MKTYGGMEVKLHVFLTSALEGGEWLASRSGRFNHGVITHGFHWIEDNVFIYLFIYLCLYVSAHQPPLRHHSGHFRHKMALLWDPHPQYEFSAFGRHFHLLLAHDSTFVHPDLQVSANDTNRCPFC